MKPLVIIDPSKPFCLYVDACDYTIGAILTQSVIPREGQGCQYPVAFGSAKLSLTQQ